MNKNKNKNSENKILNKTNSKPIVIAKNNNVNEKQVVSSLDKSTKLNLAKIDNERKNSKSSNKIVSLFSKNNTLQQVNDLKGKNHQANLLNSNQQKQINSDKKLTRWIIKNNKPHKGVSKIKPTNYNNEVIYLENVNKYVTNGYNNLHILKDINLKIKQGEFVVIYGPSGSGKTTLLTLISALDRPTTGICYLVDSNTLGVSEHGLTVFRRKNVGYIFQQYGLLSDLTVYDNIKIASSLQKNKEMRIDIDDLLKRVDMYEYRNKKASTLSGGQAQRVAICRAIVKNPKILFGDEPTGAVHVDATRQILQIFKDINKEFNTTIVLVTHNEKILEIASRILKVDDGKITADYYNTKIKTIDEINW